MKKQFAFRLFSIATITILSLTCFSCKYVDDALLVKKPKTDSIQSGDLSQSNQINTVRDFKNADTLTAIFDENGNIIETGNDTLSVNKPKSKNNNTNIVPNSSNKNISENDAKNSNIANSKINGTKIAVKNKTAPQNIKNKGAEYKNTIKKVNNSSTETDAERDYRLQKSNHAIPDL